MRAPAGFRHPSVPCAACLLVASLYAAQAQTPRETPLPPPVEVALGVPADGAPLTPEEEAGLAAAAAYLQGAWVECGSDAAPPAALRPGQGIPGVDVVLKKKPGGGSRSALRVAVVSGPGIEEEGRKEAARLRKPATPVVYYAIEVRPPGDMGPSVAEKTYSTAKSNTATKTTAVYAVTVPGRTAQEVEITVISGLSRDDLQPPIPLFAPYSTSKSNVKHRAAAATRIIALEAVRCQPSSR